MNNDIEKAMHAITNADLRPSINLTSELKELLVDISKRDGVTPEEIVAKGELRNIIENRRVSGPDRLKLLKDKLLEMRFPKYSKAKAQFRKVLKELKLSPKIKITPTPFFEDNKLRVEFSYRNQSELNEIIHSLENLAKVDVIKRALKDSENNS